MRSIVLSEACGSNERPSPPGCACAKLLDDRARLHRSTGLHVFQPARDRLMQAPALLVLAAAGARPEDIEIVCLTGGTSRMPLVEASFRKWLPGASFRRLRSFHSVVRGLVRYARTIAP